MKVKEKGLGYLNQLKHIGRPWTQGAFIPSEVCYLKAVFSALRQPVFEKISSLGSKMMSLLHFMFSSVF